MSSKEDVYNLNFKWALLLFLMFELIGVALIYNGYQNTLLLNIYTIFTVTYYLYVFVKDDDILSKYYLPIWHFGLSFLYIVISQEFHTLQFMRYNIAMFFLIVIIVRYLYKLLFKNNYARLGSIPQFWLAVGIFMFYSSCFPVLTFTNILMKRDMQLIYGIYDLVQYGNIFLSLSYLMVVICPYLTKN